MGGGMRLPGRERRPARVTGEPHLVEIVHTGAAEGAVGGRKAGRLDDVRFHAQASRKAQDRAGVLGNVGLIERDAHCPGPR